MELLNRLEMNKIMEKFNLKLFNTICPEILDKDLGKKEAVQRLSEILSDYSIEEVDRDPHKYSLSVNIDKFINDKEREGLRKNTIASYKLQLNLFANFIGEKNVQEITREDVKQFLYYREDKYDINSKRTLETIRSVLKVFFDWLKEEERIQINPLSKIKPYRISDAVIEYLELEELEKIRKYCKTVREMTLVEVFVSSGCMLSEMSDLQLSDIDWNLKVLNIKGTSERNRIVPMSEKAMKLLREYLDSRSDNCNYVFVTTRSPIRKMSNRATYFCKSVA
jgi:integrase/recombinase XerD